MKSKILASIVVAMLLMSTCAIVFTITPIVSGDSMYYLQVKTQPEGIVSINGTGWYTNSSTVHLDAPPIVNTPRYRFVVWNVDGVNKTLGQNPINVPIDNANHTAIAIYIRQYHLTMTTGYESLGVLPWTYNGSWYQTNDGGWFDVNSTAYVGISGLDAWDGVYVTPVAWAHFESFTVPGRNAWPGPQQFYSDPITMTSDMAVAANWRLQYYLYVKTDKYDPWGLPHPGEGWYWQDTIVTLTAPEGPSSPPPPAGLGWQWKFDRWEVTGTGNLYFDKSVNVTMNSNKTATAFYKAMYYLWVYDWPLNQTNLYTYSGWYENCTYVTMTAPDTIPAGAGTQYKFYGWWQENVGYFSTNHTITVHITYTGYLPIHIQACYKLQYELTVQTDPIGVAMIAGAGWYDSGTVVPLTAPDPVPIDSGSRYRFSQWVKNPGGYTDSNNATTITMNGPRTATAYYNLEFKVIVDDDQGSSFYWEYWYQNCTYIHTSWWAYTNLGGFTPSMPTMVFNRWTIIQGGVTTEWAEGVNDWVHVNAPTTLIAHYVNETYIILAAGSDVEMEAPGAYCTPFDVDVIFANFNAERHVGGKAMDLYGVEFTITWNSSLIELTGYTTYLDNIWPTGSFIQAEEINNTAGTFLFAAHAINTYEGFEGTRIMLKLHFHVIYEPCYPLHPSTTIRMNPYKLANHLDERIYPEHTDWCTYSIHALKPKLALEPCVDRFEYINDQNRVFTVDVMGYNFVKIKDYSVKVTWDKTYLKCLNVIVSEEYFQPPYLTKAYSINNNGGYLTVDLEIDHEQGSPKVNGTALLFTIVFEIVLDQNYPAWWAPNHEAYKIDIAFDTAYTQLSGQCEPWGTDNEIFTYPGRLTLVDADPWYTPHIGDLNYDGHIDLDDLMLIRMDYHGVTYDISWGQGSTGIVDIFDAVLVALNLWTGPLD
jgi:hypothetical protein